MPDRTRSRALWNPVFEDPFGRWPFREATHPARDWDQTRRTGGGFAPAVDLSEKDDRYTVVAELPGTKKENVAVELHEGSLTIRGEKRDERVEQGEHRRHVERCFGTFSRSFSLPANADGDHIKAWFEDGVLTVEVPKTAESKPRTVNIKG